MRNKFTKIISAVLLGSMALAVCSKTSVGAAGNEAYTVSTSYSYKNPETGKTADGSTNIALGESMIKSMLESTALVEEVNGKTYVTLGLGLMSNVSNVKIMTQSTSGTYTQASITKTGSTSKNGDTVNQYRFEVSSTSKYISPVLYIDPMGRDVQFYVSLKMNTKKKGTGEYKALLAGSSEDTKQTTAPKATSKPTEKPEKTEGPAKTTAPTENATATPETKATTVPTETTAALDEQTQETTAGSEAETENQQAAATVEPEEAEDTGHTRMICFIIIGVSVAGMALVGGGYYFMERKRRGKDHE